jgi:hypothetical protein
VYLVTIGEPALMPEIRFTVKSCLGVRVTKSSTANASEIRGRQLPSVVDQYCVAAINEMAPTLAAKSSMVPECLKRSASAMTGTVRANRLEAGRAAA